jgi:hypothetical protein
LQAIIDQQVKATEQLAADLELKEKIESLERVDIQFNKYINYLVEQGAIFGYWNSDEHHHLEDEGAEPGTIYCIEMKMGGSTVFFKKIYVDKFYRMQAKVKLEDVFLEQLKRELRHDDKFMNVIFKRSAWCPIGFGHLADNSDYEDILGRLAHYRKGR